MEYIVFAIFAISFLVFVFVQGVLQEKKQLKWFREKLAEEYGQAPEREYKPERFVRIPGYYEKHKKEGQLDDITWNDLGMDEVFKRMNYSLSSTGEEYLYYRLRTPEYDKEELAHFHILADYFDSHEKERIAFQMMMRKLGTTGKFSLYDYIEYMNRFEGVSNKKEFAVLGVMAASFGLMFVNLTAGILLLIAVISYQIITYFSIRKEIEPYITTLNYMVRLGEIAEQVVKQNIVVCEKEYDRLRDHIRRIKKAKQGSFWVFHDAKNSSAGNPLDAIMVYLVMIFHLDLIVFHKMIGELIKRIDDLDSIVSILGYMETAVCVSCYRASLENGYCLPFFEGDGLILKEGYHPLLNEPVKNSIKADRSVLLTGSNASGKSTFLKMTALNVILAQSVYTVAADYYSAPLYRVCSSMSLKDDLDSGESYYIVEIKSIRRIMKQAADSEQKIICFVDEVLRGTNTTERIAASTQILKHLALSGVLCFAATHDHELTELLKDSYDNYHFAEKVSDNDIVFNYKLQPGKATTKNAIRLLQLMGYEDSIIDKANEQAAYFEVNGIWKIT